MKKLLLSVIAVIMIVSMCACQTTAESDDVLTVAVGIVPEAAFIEKVGGDLVDVVTLVPPGYSPANYQPTTTEMQALSDADVYFTLQMPTEQANILPKVGDFNAALEIVDLRKAISEVYPLLNTNGREIASGDDESVDPHVWLSPKRVIVMVETIADKLSEIDPDNAGIYRSNAESYITELESLDTEIQESVSTLENKSFLIYHAAYGYFSDDYGLTMVAIEIAGQQATASELQNVIDYASTNHIKTVFYQEEFDDSQAETIAEAIGGTVKKTAPLSADYIQGLKDFVNALTESEE